MSEPLTSRDLTSLILARHSDRREWSVFFELRNAPGFAPTRGDKRIRTIDALAQHNWGGQQRIAYEIKVSRSDWLRELDQPSKAAAFEDQVHEFWITAPPEVVKPAELPEGWGLLVAHGSELRRIVRAKRRKPKALTEDLMLSMLRQASMAPASARLYRYGDRELTEQELVLVASEIYRTTIAREVALVARSRADDLGREAAQVKRQAEEQLKDAELGRAVREMLGAVGDWSIRRELQQLIATRQRVALVGSLRSVRASVAMLLEKVDGVLAAEPEREAE